MTASSVSERNVELARKGYEAFNTGDVQTVFGLFADDVVWHISGSGPLAGDYRGKEAVMELFGRFLQVVDDQKTEVHDILANDQHTVVLATVTFGRQGRTLEQRVTDVIHPDAEGRVLEYWRFFEDQGKADEFISS
jgi:ketosteroid isomerase-like protein